MIRPGETLWSIADDLLGDRATPARIAALVDRLWRTNAKRIASGSPDMIGVGEQLRAPRTL